MRILLICYVIFVSGQFLFADENESKKPTPPEGLTLAELELFSKLLDRDWHERPEWAEMAVSIMNNEPMGDGRGWFKPATKTFDWKWLAATFPKETEDNIIKPNELGELTEAEFKRLDHNEDGGISPHDFDWSNGNPMMKGMDMSDLVFQKLDLDFNGRVTKKELDQWFEKAGGGFDFLTMMDLRKGLNLKMPNMFEGGGKQSDQRLVMFRRLLNGELGSLTPGPAVGDEAPEINLPLLVRNADHTKLVLTDQFIKLPDYRGKKPVVLIFGSFT